jgi:hypothetical protein
MGQHSSPDQGPFYRSVARWLMPWIAAAIVVGIVVWVSAGTFGNEGTPVSQSSPSPTPSESKSKPKSTPTPAKPSPTPKAKPSPKDTLITKGISLQVLNAANDMDATNQIAHQLRDLGFQVVAVEDSLSNNAETHVYWANAGAQEAARRLATKMGWLAGPVPSSLSLSAEVDLHVLVGADES